MAPFGPYEVVRGTKGLQTSLEMECYLHLG